jgi:nucleoside-diphosphate-sugar epimerase
MKVFVTGASGFLGHVVCAEALSRGHEVHALVRRPGSEPAGTIAVAGDLTDAGALTAALTQIEPDYVIHLAAEIATQRDLSKIAAVNVAGTKHLLEACTAAGNPKFVFTSTVVTGEANGELLTEDSDLPYDTPYGESKRVGEQLVLESGLPAVIIRPSHVYGPGGWYAHEIVKRLQEPGRLVVIGNGKNLWDVVHVDDVAAACLDGAEKAPAGAIYHVADDEPLTQYEFVALTAQALGVGKPRCIPKALAKLVAGPNTVIAVARSARSSNAKIKRELGWTPRFPSAKQGVPAAVASLAQ